MGVCVCACRVIVCACVRSRACVCVCVCVCVCLNAFVSEGASEEVTRSREDVTGRGCVN